MTQTKALKNLFFYLLLAAIVLPTYAQKAGDKTNSKVQFSVNGFQLGETYSVSEQDVRLQKARISVNETEFGPERIYMYGSDKDHNFTFFQFCANELQEFCVTKNNQFELKVGDVKIKVGDSFDKLKTVPNLAFEQAMIKSSKPAKPVKGGWILKHPDLLEDVFRITVYEENGIVTAFSGLMIL